MIPSTTLRTSSEHCNSRKVTARPITLWMYERAES